MKQKGAELGVQFRGTVHAQYAQDPGFNPQHQKFKKCRQPPHKAWLGRAGREMPQLEMKQEILYKSQALAWVHVIVTKLLQCPCCKPHKPEATLLLPATLQRLENCDTDSNPESGPLLPTDKPPAHYLPPAGFLSALLLAYLLQDYNLLPVGYFIATPTASGLLHQTTSLHRVSGL